MYVIVCIMCRNCSSSAGVCFVQRESPKPLQVQRILSRGVQKAT